MALFFSFALIGCASVKHRDDIPQNGTITRTITWILSHDAEKECDEHFGKRVVGKRIACAHLKGQDCTIYAKPPKNEEDRLAMLVLGHEALHCFVGEFHY